MLLQGLFACSGENHSTSDVIQSPHASSASKFAVATAHPLATQAGVEILQQGGNAFDAAVAVSATLAVVEPYASGLGGGGFYLLQLAAETPQSSSDPIMIDAREVAPAAAHRDMYLDERGEPTQESIRGARAAGIPGVPAALVHVSKKYGQLPLHKSLEFAIRMATDGFAVDALYQQRATSVLESLQASTEAAKIFLHDGKVPELGHRIQQLDLARVLRQLAEEGFAGFYNGEIAQQLVKGVQDANGIWQLQDLENYQVHERTPVMGNYHDMQVVSASLPSSGGVVLMQALNMLATQELQNLTEVQKIHVIVEAMRRAYLDRTKYLGDSDFVDVPVDKLLTKPYAEQAFANFNMQQATSSHSLLPTSSNLNSESSNTTHFSIIDAFGNYVAATLSINYYFGSGFVAPGTGILLNNEMDDFAIKAGHSNLWGLQGATANAIEPGKRMLSSMSPSFLYKDNRVAILGTPGGSRIISMLLLAALEFSNGATAEQIVSLPRYHHQFMPDVVQFEKNSLSFDKQMQLQRLGHELKELTHDYGNMQIIVWDKNSNQLTVASDPRRIGKAQVIE